MDPSSRFVLVFPSKIDRWIVWLTAIPLLVSAAAVTSALLASPPLSAALLMVGLEVVIVAFIAWTYRSTRYLVTDREVIARSGPFRWRIEIAGIGSIRPSRNPRSSPAMSLDRLEVRYGGGRRLLISPQDQEGFLEAVVARSGNLVRERDSIRPARTL
jgi:Bacterial PH domain